MRKNVINYLDFYDWSRGSSSTRPEFVEASRAEFRDTGFFRLRNHGISEELLTRNRGLMAQFFALPVEVKMRYHFPETDGQLGYTPLDVEKAVNAELPDHKEFLMFGDMNQLPDIPEVPGLRETSLELFVAYGRLFVSMMEVVARSLALPEDYFTAHLGNCSLRLIHYPKHDNPATGIKDDLTVQRGGNVVGMCNEPHTDIDALTLLHSSQPGLQLWCNKEWVPVPCEHESLVVNIGDMLEHLTGGRYQSGIHRVVCPPGVDRYSMPFFGHFLPPTSIVPLPHLGESDLEKFHFQTEIEYLLFRLDQIKLRDAAKKAAKQGTSAPAQPVTV